MGDTHQGYQILDFSMIVRDLIFFFGDTPCLFKCGKQMTSCNNSEQDEAWWTKQKTSEIELSGGRARVRLQDVHTNRLGLCSHAGSDSGGREPETPDGGLLTSSQVMGCYWSRAHS